MDNARRRLAKAQALEASANAGAETAQEAHHG